MNTNQAKKLSLPKIMSSLGYEPIKRVNEGRELWYTSPFRVEKEASFHTSFLGGKWIWNDFGDVGGTVIDFVMRHENYTSVKDALRFLNDMFQEPLFTKIEQRTSDKEAALNLFSFQQLDCEAVPSNPVEKDLQFLSAHPIGNPVIYQYLEEERCIPKEIVDLYLVEVKYLNKRNGREYFAFGMKNKSHGYEIRVASNQYAFKSALIERDITVIRGTSSNNKAANIFEGMMDFLSFLVMMSTPNLTSDSIIMHSLSSFTRACEFTRKKQYDHLNTFLDNDKSGEQHTCLFVEEFADYVKPQNDMYQNYKDLNEALMDNQISKFLRIKAKS